MPDPTLPPYPAITNARIEIFGPDAEGGRWDVSAWDQATWAGVDWRDVTPESMVCEMVWGADDPSGVLTATAAGSWLIKTYDPERKLDPSNGASIYAQSLRPGRPFRLSHADENGALHVVRQGVIEEVTYSIGEKTGTLRGTDTISIMSAAKMLPEQNLDPAMPNTLRARANYLVKKAGLDNLVSVEDAGDFGTVVLSHAPIHYYRMGQSNPPAEPAADLGTQPKNGGFGPTTITTPGIIPGNNAVSFVNAQDFMYVAGNARQPRPNQLIVAPGTQALELPVEFTIGMFVQNTGAYNQIMIAWPGAPGSFNPRLNASRNVEIWAYGGATLLYRTRAQAFDNQWNDVWFVQDAEKLTIILNGVPETLYNPPVWTPVGNSVFRVGSNGNPPNGFKVDEFMMFDHAMPVNDIATIRDLAYGVIGSYDPPVAKITDVEASVWAHITTAAYDALYGCWIDRLGILRFRSFGDPRDNGLAVGGIDGMGLSTVDVAASIANVYTRIIAYDETAPEVEVIRADTEAAVIYGDITLRRQNPVPQAGKWADAVLLDRSGASLQYQPGAIYPQTVADLLTITDLNMLDIMHIRVDDIVPTIDVAARVLGGKITVDTGTGWSAIISSYIPASEWAEDITPPEPPITTPPPTKVVTRLYQCTKDTRAARNSSNNNVGSGTAPYIPIGAWQGWRNRGIFDFDQINFSDVYAVDKCELLLNTTTQEYVAFGSSPKVTIKRIIENWSEGSVGNPPSASNSTVYPGPSTTNASSVTRTLPSQNLVPVALAMTDICRSWFKGSAQYGVALYSAGEDNTKYTTEVFDRSYSNVDGRPKLRLTLRVLV